MIAEEKDKDFFDYKELSSEMWRKKVHEEQDAVGIDRHRPVQVRLRTPQCRRRLAEPRPLLPGPGWLGQRNVLGWFLAAAWFCGAAAAL
jgi:hypothetical protein